MEGQPAERTSQIQSAAGAAGHSGHPAPQSGPTAAARPRRILQPEPGVTGMDRKQERA